MNGSLTPADVFAGEKVSVWWLCPDGRETRTRVDTRVGGDRECIDCYHGRSAKATPLSIAIPSLAQQVHPAKNGLLTAADVSPGSGRVLWWRCVAGHEWDAPVCNRVKTPGCPYCERRRPSAEFSFLTEYPEIAERWHAELNDRAPCDVLPGSDYEAWWTCAREVHTYRRVVEAEARGLGCRDCSKTLDPQNSLAAVHPEIAKEWHPTLNDRTPWEVSKANSYHAAWRCEVGHEWSTSVSSRTVAGTGCPDCFVPATSQRETLIREKVAHLLGGLAPADTMGPIPGLGRLGHVDIVIRHLRLVVEYDGSYWHRDRLKRDIDKADGLRQRGWSVIRLREQPLPVLTNHDISIPQGHPPAWIAGMVLTKFLDITFDPDWQPGVRSTIPTLPVIRLIEPWPRSSPAV